MASVIKELVIRSSAAKVWEVIGDFPAGPIRMAPGFVVDVGTEAPDVRVVTFANGTVARERLVGVDHGARRIAYSVVSGSMEHDNASMQVVADGSDGDRCRLVWIHDVLPDEAGPGLAAAMAQGLVVIGRTLGGG
jgi:hypothetical protein